MADPEANDLTVQDVTVANDAAYRRHVWQVALHRARRERAALDGKIRLLEKLLAGAGDRALEPPAVR